MHLNPETNDIAVDPSAERRIDSADEALHMLTLLRMVKKMETPSGYSHAWLVKTRQGETRQDEVERPREKEREVA